MPLSFLSLEDTTNLSNPVEIDIKKFQNHRSVQVIRENINLNQEFFFKQVEVDEIFKEIMIAIRMELFRISHLII